MRLLNLSFLPLGSIGFLTYIGQQIRIIKRKILEIFHVFENIGQLVKIIRRKLVDIACTLQNIYTKSADVLNLSKRKEKKCQLFQEDKNLTSPRYPVRNRKQTIFYGVNE